MKKLLTSVLAIAFLACTVNLTAQDEKAAPSPFSKLEQKIGTTDVTVEYSRPSVKDRKIFGELVPFGKKWRTGANAATKITFSKDVTVQGTAVPAGTYAVFTTPSEKSWDVHFFTFGEPGAGAYNDATPAATVKTMAQGTGDVQFESFIIFFDMLRDNSAQMVMAWDKTAVVLDLGVK